MCETTDDSAEALSTMPRAAPGEATDPITLEPVDEVVVTTLVDNVYDGLLMDSPGVRRAAFGVGVSAAGQFEDGSTTVGLMAEHGFSALVEVRRGTTTTRLLFDTGLSPEAMVTNAERLGVDVRDVQAVVLSHGHFDHAGGLAGLIGRRSVSSLPMVLHPEAWTRRRLAIPGQEPRELPTISKKALIGEGFDVIERRQPSLLADRSVLITGEVDRTTEFEQGMFVHEAWDGSQWKSDPMIVDDQALVVNVAGRGLVIVTGCGHAGAVNIVRHAMRLTAVPRLHALIGGLHLGGLLFEPIIPPTVAALTEYAPSLLVPGHCTGWRAQHALAAALPDAWLQSSSGTEYRLAAA